MNPYKEMPCICALAMWSPSVRPGPGPGRPCAEDVKGRGAENLLTKNGASDVALVRPARFLAAHSAQGQALAVRATALAAALGVPALRELVVKRYLLPYAHSKDRVVLLALKHERQLVFQIA